MLKVGDKVYSVKLGIGRVVRYNYVNFTVYPYPFEVFFVKEDVQYTYTANGEYDLHDRYSLKNVKRCNNIPTRYNKIKERHVDHTICNTNFKKS
jgi:hypothetical protein